MYIRMVKKREAGIWRERRKKKKERESSSRKKKEEKDLIAPMIFSGSLDARGFEGWLEKYLLPSLEKKSVLIMDNAPIHRKNKVKELVEKVGHEIVFLPKYSPDLNDIEHDFSALKRKRMYEGDKKSLDEIIRDYCAA